MNLSQQTRATLATMTDEAVKRGFAYLDQLRASGSVNMWGATPYLQRARGMTGDEASAVHLAWMESFDDELPPADRVAAVRKAMEG